MIGGADLRVTPVVTRLTVYRRPQVTRRASKVVLDAGGFLWRRLLACVRVALCGALRVISGGNQVDGLPPAPSTLRAEASKRKQEQLCES